MGAFPRFKHFGLRFCLSRWSLMALSLSALTLPGVWAQPPVSRGNASDFIVYKDQRSYYERALNAIGMTNLEVGRSFALVAGVDNYPMLEPKNRILKPAGVDLDKLVAYLRDYEFFDEIIVLRNQGVTDEKFKYYLQGYLPERLRQFPKSRFLFAYSGHGIEVGSRGYLLQSGARSFEDIENSISLEALTGLYRPVTEQAYYSLALINACHSGSFGAVAFGTDTNRRLLPREPGSHVITAGSTSQLAWHHLSAGEGSLFFEKILAGLGGRADDQPIQKDGSRGDGVITATELFGYISQEIQLETDQEQHPQLVDFARAKLGSFFFLSRQPQLRAHTVPEWEGWRSNFGSKASNSASIGSVGTYSFTNAQKAAQAFQQGHFAESTQLYSQACSQGELRGCSELGRAYRYGVGGLAFDFPKSVGLFRIACERGDQLGCVYLGESFDDGIGGLSRDRNRAQSYYRDACNSGEPRGCTIIGLYYDVATKEDGKDDRKAALLYKDACKRDDMLACTYLASFYVWGERWNSKRSKASPRAKGKGVLRRRNDGLF